MLGKISYGFYGFFIGVLILSGAAFAQNSAPMLDKEGVPYSSRYWKGSAGKTVISLIRKQELSENQFVLRITDPFMVTGCADIGNYAYSAEYKDIYLDIALGGLTVDMRDQPQYAHLQCDRHLKAPVADIVINRSDLEAHQTKTIRLHNGTDTNYYDITLEQNRVLLLPDKSTAGLATRFEPQSIPGRKTALSYWFYPLGTVILWMPGAETGNEKNLAALRNFAQARGLTPLESLFPDFKSPLKDARYQYFVDTAGQFDSGDAALTDGREIGTVRTERKLFGLEKDEIKTDVMPVYAKRPGMQE